MNLSFSTFGSVVDEAANKLHIDIDAGTLPGADRTSLERVANRARKIFLSKVILGNNINTMVVNTIADVITSVVVASGATTISVVDGSLWPTSGELMVYGKQMSFTRSGNTLTVATLGFSIESGTYLSLGYALPEDFLRPRTVAVNGIERDIARKGDTATMTNGTFIIHNNFLFLPATTTSGSTIIIHYVQSQPNLTANDVLDVADFLDDYIVFCICATIHDLLYEPELAATAMQNAKTVLQEGWDFSQRLEDRRNQYLLPRYR